MIELVEYVPSGAYRAVYAIRFADAIYVLHCFQMKSAKGIATPKRDIELIASRLRDAERMSKGEGHA